MPHHRHPRFGQLADIFARLRSVKPILQIAKFRYCHFLGGVILVTIDDITFRRPLFGTKLISIDIRHRVNLDISQRLLVLKCIFRNGERGLLTFFYLYPVVGTCGIIVVRTKEIAIGIKEEKMECIYFFLFGIFRSQLTRTGQHGLRQHPVANCRQGYPFFMRYRTDIVGFLHARCHTRHQTEQQSKK